ncbi:ABC-type branched-subunit amino acid transport system substrate-binding protein [Streptomyces umbrinus]|uniref:ABC-type branched-subunit amino acid transport system substrate-binding protein n=1 Tax=Streptomyces umbrinus TaxID=67370 RepID=A0ABU0SZI8_9ACTN|nr:ABC transporter substrate-binding protein [Streptomyces umbrinus]MDQ1028978.1 ABC-type branched-subunit amino acid transport system substrate-binding protein [Streptomyces umbrinus]
MSGGQSEGRAGVHAGVRALRPGDPSSVGGHRLLGRLGAGGMGVVYLARSTGGALVALKVIRAEYAADHGFRARFRREAEAASGLTGRWLVPVTAAEPEAREPWLTAAFVPGPSLAEAVTLHGPLPERTVRALGARLAEALTEVHAAGLVHRDVKPGNVLLALDGPRLIDFGIARSTGATALTASDVVIGSPGYLSPEQARAQGGDIGPPSDVFSLGCVLAYAATGRRPFGTGTAAAVIFRTVHEEPDLDAVPWTLVPLLTACLAKAPEARPTAQEVRDALADEDGPESGPEGGRESRREGGPESGPVSGPVSGREDDWLPPALPRLIAERSSAVLALPDPAPAPGPVTLVQPPERPALSRRRLLTLGSAAGVVLTGGGLAAWAASRPEAGGDGSTRSGPLPRYVIGLHADLSGPDRAIGRAQERGARLAVADFNSGSRDGRAFDLALKVLDDAGQAKRAEEMAGKFVADHDVYAVIGPTGSTAAGTAVSRYEKGLLPIVTVSSGGDDEYSLSTTRAYFRLRPDENTLSTPFIHYLTNVEKSRRTALVDDRAANRTSWQIVRTLTTYPPSKGTTTTHVVPADSEDFDTVAAAVLASDAQAVVYAGSSPHRAARCARALEQAGFRGTRMAPEPVLQTAFLKEAGRAAEGWVMVTTYVDPAELPAAAHFVKTYRKRFGVRTVERFAVEAYDALLFVAQGMRELGSVEPERGAMVRRLRQTTHKGLAKAIEFDPVTKEFRWVNGLFLHRVRNGTPDFLGRYDRVKEA